MSKRTSVSLSFRLNRKFSTTTNEKFVSKLYYNPKLMKFIKSIGWKSSVDLSFWYLIDDDLPVIVNKLIEDKQCSALDLCGNKLTHRSVSIFAANRSKNSTLEILDLSFNQLTDVGVRGFSELVINNQYVGLTKLMLNKNRISNEGVRYLAEMLKTNRTIKELWLSDNEIGNEGVQHLTNALATRNSILQVLILSFNIFITNQSIESLFKLFQSNSALRSLSIHNCNLTSAGQLQLQQEANRKNNFHLEI